MGRRAWFRFHSIRTRLLLTVGVLCVSLVAAITFVISHTSTGVLREQARATAQRMVVLSADSLSKFLDARSTSVHFWANLPAVRGLLGDALYSEVFSGSFHSFLDSIREREPWIRNVVILGNDEVLFDDFQHESLAPRSSLDVGQLKAIPEETFFLQNLPGETLPSLIYRSRVEGRDGQGSIFAFYDIERIYRATFEGIKVGNRGFFALAAQADKAHYWFPRELESEELSAFSELVRDGRSVSSLPASHDAVHINPQGLRKAPLFVVGVASDKDVLAPVRQMVLSAAGVGTGLAALALLLSLWFSYQLSRPIVSLAEEVRHYSVGRGAIRLQETANDEVGQLSRDFHAMSLRLVGAYDDLRSQAEQLDRLRHQLEQVLVATRTMSTATNRFDAVSAAIFHIVIQLREIQRCGVEVVLRSDGSAGRPFVCYCSMADAEMVRNARMRHSTPGTLHWQEMPLPADGALYDNNMAINDVSEAVAVSGEVIRLLVVWNKDLQAIVTLRCGQQLRVDDSCRKFLTTLGHSLAAALQSLANAESEIRRRVEERERSAAAEQRRLLDLLGLSAELSDRLNSPLLTVVNVIERLEKCSVGVKVDALSREELGQFLEVWQRCHPMLVQAKSRIVDIRHELEGLRERHNGIEPTGVLSRGGNG